MIVEKTSFVILALDLVQRTPSSNQADQFSNVLHTAPYGANEIKTNGLQRQLRVCWYLQLLDNVNLYIPDICHISPPKIFSYIFLHANIATKDA